MANLKAVKVVKDSIGYSLAAARDGDFSVAGEAIGVVDLRGKKPMWKGGIKVGDRVHRIEFDIRDRQAAYDTAKRLNALHAKKQRRPKSEPKSPIFLKRKYAKALIGRAHRVMNPFVGDGDGVAVYDLSKVESILTRELRKKHRDPTVIMEQIWETLVPGLGDDISVRPILS